MKNYTLVFALLLTIGVNAQNRNHKFGFTAGTAIQHYSGDLGNSFFKFNTCCFAAEVFSLSYYLDNAFDFTASSTIGDFGYWQRPGDQKVVPLGKRCPGCKGEGMGELRSRMYTGNIAIKYKLDNGTVFREDSKISPYMYVGVGVNYLADRMKRNCVNTGTHFSVNTGAGLKYNVTSRFSFGYNIAVSHFVNEHIYATVGGDNMVMDGKKDKCLQNTLYLGMTF